MFTCFFIVHTISHSRRLLQWDYVPSLSSVGAPSSAREPARRPARPRRPSRKKACLFSEHSRVFRFTLQRFPFVGHRPLGSPLPPCCQTDATTFSPSSDTKFNTIEAARGGFQRGWLVASWIQARQTERHSVL